MKNILKGKQRSDQKFEELATNVLGFEAAIAFLLFILLAFIVFLTGVASAVEVLKGCGWFLLLLLANFIFAIICFGVISLITDSFPVKHDPDRGIVRELEIFYPGISFWAVFTTCVVFPASLYVTLYKRKLFDLNVFGYVLAAIFIVFVIALLWSFLDLLILSIKMRFYKGTLCLCIDSKGHAPFYSRMNGVREGMLCVSFWKYKKLFSHMKGKVVKELWIQSDYPDDKVEKEDFIAPIIDECFDKGISVFKVNIDKSKDIKKVRISRVIIKAETETKTKTELHDFTEAEGVSYFGRLNFNVITDYSNVPFPVQMKYEFPNHAISLMNASRENSEIFYQLIKLVESVFHYMALYKLSADEELKKKYIHDGFLSSIGMWQNIAFEKAGNKKTYQADNPQGEKVLSAFKFVHKATLGADYGRVRVTYNEICSIITSVRNRYLGHGTMVFSVTQDLIDAFITLVGVIMEDFYGKDVVIDVDKDDEDGVILARSFYDQKEKHSSLQLISAISNEGDTRYVEYLDYRNGSCVCDTEKVYDLDYAFEGENS